MSCSGGMGGSKEECTSLHLCPDVPTNYAPGFLLIHCLYAKANSKPAELSCGYQNLGQACVSVCFRASSSIFKECTDFVIIPTNANDDPHQACSFSQNILPPLCQACRAKDSLTSYIGLLRTSSGCLTLPPTAASANMWPHARLLCRVDYFIYKVFTKYLQSTGIFHLLGDCEQPEHCSK